LGLPLVILVPFLGKAIHIDDAFFLAIADHITRDPLHPYDFRYNWTGHLDYVWDEMKNPPFIFYFQAFILRFVGRSEPVLHIIFLLYPIAASLAMYALARRVVRRPLYPTLLLLLCPAFLVSATSIMMDVPMLAFYMTAVACFVTGAEQNRPGSIIAAGLAASLAILTKYFALSLIPLLAAYALLVRKNLRRNLFVLFLPATAFAAWHLHGEAFHGGGHLWKAMSYQADHHAQWRHVLRQSIATLTFTGGLLVVPLLSTGGFRTKRASVLAACAGVAVSIGLLFVTKKVFSLSYNSLNEILFLLFAIGTVVFLIHAFADTLRAHDPLGWLLRLWLWGGLFFCFYLNWTVNARTILLFAPPALLLYACWTEENKWLRRGAVTLTLALGVVVAIADYDLAEFGRNEADRISRRYTNKPRVHFIGHWGFQYYMEEAGFTHVDFRNPGLRQGDTLVIPMHHSVSNRPLGELHFPGSQVDLTYYGSALPVAVMNSEAGAGLHGSFLGFLPFAYSRQPIEIVRVFRW
jgi:hypothetical protein